jgi:two-component system chemotaxis sensor kinase CheA
VLTVTDDGAGIDVAKIRQVAKARGVMPAEAIDALNDAAATDLIFAPGFSTADAVTDISGRGVGMDFVRTAIEALGGRATIASTPGQGTELQMVLPQGVTIGTVMTVLAGGDRFGVPMEAILETARVANDRITVIGAGEAFALRDSTVPLLRLAQLLDLPPVPRAPTGANVLVVDAAGQRVGIEVDGFAERTDLLLRPLSGLLAGMPGLLGTSVTGDGRVLMILNLPELVR